MVEYWSCPRERRRLRGRRKNFEKVLKKVLTSRRGCGIIAKLSARRGGKRRSLKIEQQERSTKQKQKCEIHSRQRVIYTQQVKEAKRRNSEADCTSFGRTSYNRNDFESLILAQDERWRRA